MIFGAFQRAGGRCEPAGRDKIYPLFELPVMSRRVVPLTARLRGRLSGRQFGWQRGFLPSHTFVWAWEEFFVRTRRQESNLQEVLYD